MAESTRNFVALKKVEERLAARLDACLVELAGSLQRTLSDSLKETVQKLVSQSSFNDSQSSNDKKASKQQPYFAATRCSRIKFPRFNDENTDQWLYQYETFFFY